MAKNKHWVYLSEVKLYYEHALEQGEFKGTFEAYKNKFLKGMTDINLPHTIIGDVAQG